jgi:hypothetical protein
MILMSIQRHGPQPWRAWISECTSDSSLHGDMQHLGKKGGLSVISGDSCATCDHVRDGFARLKQEPEALQTSVAHDERTRHPNLHQQAATRCPASVIYLTACLKVAHRFIFRDKVLRSFAACDWLEGNGLRDVLIGGGDPSGRYNDTLLSEILNREEEPWVFAVSNERNCQRTEREVLVGGLECELLSVLSAYAAPNGEDQEVPA